MIDFTLYTANCCGDSSNCVYPNKAHITDSASFVAAIKQDHVCAAYKNNYRSNDNFLETDVLPMDCDNDHSDDPKDWIYPLDVVMAFPDVSLLVSYGIGMDGRIGMYCEEKDRSWCSSNAANDHRAITIEVASDTNHPYAVNAKAYAALIDLCTDICKRNGIKKLLWKADKSLIGQTDKQNMTVHRWFANKSCPGDYLYNRHSDIAEQVNNRLAVNTEPVSSNQMSGIKEMAETNMIKKPYLVSVSIGDLNIRKGPGTNYAKTGKFTGKGVFTIIAEANGKGATRWGKLKSGTGWISLDFAKRI